MTVAGGLGGCGEEEALDWVAVNPQWLIVNKPSGLLSVPGRGPDKQDCLLRRVAHRFPEALVVHRLDRDTSGLILFARSKAAQRDLSDQFARRGVDKMYVAVVHGRVALPRGEVHLPLAKDFANPPRHAVNFLHGKPAQTSWRVLSQTADRSRLELVPFTGRSHQLRVHLRALGHPIVGDPLYGPEPEHALDPAAADSRQQRLLLHAARLGFRDPARGTEVSLYNAPPF